MAGYKEIRQMWADLGMNLEAHDQFVNSFPQVLKEVILSQPERPEAIAYFTGVTQRLHGARPYELYEHRQAGGKVVGTYCVYVPDEIIFALGAVSSGLCGGDQFWVPGGEAVLPANMCPLVKSSLGSRLDRTSPFCQVADLYVGENTCDGKKKAWEILSKDAEMHIIDLPQMKRPADVTKLAAEFGDLARRIEELTGNRLTFESLLEGIRLINGRRSALQRLNAARAATPPPLSGVDALMVVQIAFYDDPARFAEKANALAEELEERAAAGTSPFPADAPRIMIAGTPMAMPFWKLPHLVETSGGAVVVEELCTGTRYYENLVSEEAEDLEGLLHNLAQRYLKTNCACFTPNPGRIDDILRLKETFKVDGVIDYSLQFCGLYTTESHFVLEALKERGIPALHLETDYTAEDAGQLRTRIEAFVEMLRK